MTQYVANYIRINLKAIGNDLEVIFTTIEKTSKFRVQLSTTECLHTRKVAIAVLSLMKYKSKLS